MRNSDTTLPDISAQMPYRLRHDGWWLVGDLLIPCNGPRQGRADCALQVIDGGREEDLNDRNDYERANQRAAAAQLAVASRR